MSAVQQDEKYSKEIVERISLGMDAESFINSKLGQKVIGRAQAQAFDAMQTLKSIDPTLTNEVRALQNQIFRAESFELWINDCMLDGEVAEAQLGEAHD